MVKIGEFDPSNLTEEQVAILAEEFYRQQALNAVTSALIYLVLFILLIVWFVKTLKQALKLKAVGPKDKFVATLLFLFTGIIGAIIFLKIKINRKLSKKSKRKKHH